MIFDSKIQQAIEVLHEIKDFTDKNILNQEILNAAAICKIYDKLAFAEFRSKCKSSKQVTLSILNEAVSDYAKKIKKENSKYDSHSKVINIANQNEDIFKLPALPNDISLFIPPEYICSTSGIIIDRMLTNGKHQRKFVALSPFFVVEHFKNIDDQTEKYKLAIYNKFKGWDFIIASRYDLLDERKIVALSKYGLGVTSVIARDTVNYIGELIRLNVNNIPTTRIVNQLGWRENFTEFVYPPKGSDYIVETGNDSELGLIYQTKGNRQLWLTHYDEIKNHKYARLAFASALAASFIEIINMRNMTLCVYGKSGGGKTAGIIKFPMSIHGNPKYVPTFNSTFNSLERRAVTSNNLPFAVDELQNITSKFQLENIDKFAHIIGEGISKGRYDKNGEVEVLKHFSTIALITGEQPLTNFTSDQGKKRRTLEFHCKEVLPQDLAEKTHEFVTDNYGLIGREWIDFIKNHINDIKSLYKFFRNKLKLKRPDAIVDHINFLSASYTADVFFNFYFRNMEFELVLEELNRDEQIHSILKELATEAETTNSEQAKDFIKEFIVSRKRHFAINGDNFVQDPIFGVIKKEYIFIYPQQFRKELKRAGFSPEKTINELIVDNFLTYDDERKLYLIPRSAVDFSI